MQIADACLTFSIQRSIAATDVHVQQWSLYAVQQFYCDNFGFNMSFFAKF